MISDAEHRQSLFGDLRSENAEEIVEDRRRQRRGPEPIVKRPTITGENHFATDLTPEDVRNIREMYANTDASYPEIAEIYGIHRDTVGQIVRRDTWDHVH